jgi:competence protein ComEC
MRSPLLALAASFALGIVVARFAPAKLLGISLLFPAIGICLFAGLLFLRGLRLRTTSLLVLAGFLLAGAAAARLFEVRFLSNHVRHLETWGVDLADPVRLEGSLVSTPQVTPYGLQFDVEVHRLESRRHTFPTTGKVRLRLATSGDSEAPAIADSLHLQYGDSIRALVKLRHPRIYQNPGSFDFRAWMASIEDLYWVGTIKNPLLVEKLPRRNAPVLATFFERSRHRLLRGIDDLYPPWCARGRGGAVLKAILLGDRSALDSDTIENFRKTGLYHLLVIAGLHVGLLALLAGALLRLLPLRRFWRSLLVLAFLLLYACLVEQRAPTLRATLMIAVYLVARLLDREHAALNAIGFAALALLVLRPAWLFETGFQLSFAAALLIAGLAVPILERTTEPYRRALWQLNNVDLDPSLAPRQAQFRLDLRGLINWLTGRFRRFDRHPRLAAATVTGPARLILWTANMLLFSAVLQLGLLLPMAETFHRVSFVGVALNALAIPVMTVLLAIAVPTVMLAATVPALAIWPAKLLNLVMQGLFALTDLPNLPTWLSYRVPAPPAWVAWGFAVSVVAAAWALGRRRRVFWVSLAAGGIFAGLVALHPFAPRLPRGVLEMTAIDCGGGDSLFVVLPDQTTILVDGGGSRWSSTQEGTFQGRRWDPGEDIISPYLWSRGLKRLDTVVLTHAHADHLGGLAAMVRNFSVGKFWHGPNPPTPPYEALLEALRQRGIPIRQMLAGERFDYRDTSIDVLWPRVTHPISQAVSNDDSVVLRIGDGGAHLLLTGDISDRTEAELLASGVPVASQVLKVAHHGAQSSSSPDFLARVKPQVAIVTAESGGLSNLPSLLALERLRAAGAKVFRTDLDGAVTVTIRGASLAVQNFASSGNLPHPD